MFWTIDIENEEEMFDLFGAAGKYPAEVAKTVDKGKIIDSGKIRLGIQRDGYHEYFLEGNKFETKMHYRVIKIDGKDMAIWTGFKQEPADKEGDKGKWNIYQDRQQIIHPDRRIGCSLYTRYGLVGLRRMTSAVMTNNSHDFRILKATT